MRTKQSLRLIVASLAISAACTGNVTSGNPDNNGKNGDPTGNNLPPGVEDGDFVGQAPRFARLSNEQWNRTIQDLFYMDAPPSLSAVLQADPPLGRFDNNVARLTFSQGHWRSFQRAAEEVAELVASSPSMISAIAPSDRSQDPAVAGQQFVEQFGARAFRRPLTDDEIAKYVAIFSEGPTHYPEQETFDAGVHVVLEAMLQSPHFLYRVEDSEKADGDTIALTGYEVATRLSFALWNTMPSDDLFAAVRAGELDTPEGVKKWAERMLDDPKAHEQFRHFHTQAFDISGYSDLSKNEELFPQWNAKLGNAMEEEAVRFLDAEVFGGGGVRELLTSNRAYVNADLAALYDIDGNFGSDFVEVSLDPAQRSGMLTRLGFLTKNATLSQSDPIHRGVFVNLNLICMKLEGVPNLPDEFDYRGDTNRERIDSITGPGTCGGDCHGKFINPVGFSLEHYDALGRYRTEESGFPVDAADTYEFESGEKLVFDNALELSEQLGEAMEVHSCYTQQLVEYLLGRSLGQKDMELAQAFAKASLENGMSIREMILGVLGSRAFRFRAVQGGAQ